MRIQTPTKSAKRRGGAALYSLLAIALSLFCCFAFAVTARAIEGDYLEDAATEIDAADAKEITLDTSNATCSGFDGSSTEMELNKTYSITYKNGVKYGGKTLTVRTSVKLVDDGRFYLDADGNRTSDRPSFLKYDTGTTDSNGNPVYAYSRVPYAERNDSDTDVIAAHVHDTYGEAIEVVHPGDNTYSGIIQTRVYKNTTDERLSVSWAHNQNTKIEWTIEMLDANGNAYSTVLLTGIRDPDESNYLFDTTSTDIFYVVADYSGADGPEFGQGFDVRDDGIFPVNANGDNVATGYENGLFLMSFNGNPSFGFESVTFAGGYLAAPYFYSPIYKITYELDGGENDPDNPNSYDPGSEITIKPPTKPGYKFVEWKEGDKINETDTGNKTFTAVWDPIYTITYDANGGQGTMDDQEYMGSDKTKMSKDNEFTNPGKTFRGFYAYVTDPETGEETQVVDENGNPILFESATDMAKYFEGKPGGTSIRMEAQWGVTVTYIDPETGKTYQKTVIPEDGEEPEPPADPTRDGYTFVGWKRTVDEYGNIIYEAMWEKNPEPAKPAPKPKPTLIPATGDPFGMGVGIIAAASAAATVAGAALRKKEQ